jgi:uncharacterized linocin/CFP29 family protein
MNGTTTSPQVHDTPPVQQPPDPSHHQVSDAPDHISQHNGGQNSSSQHQVSFGPTLANNGRDKIHWSKDVWDRIDKAVHAEMLRTRVAQKFLPIRPVFPRTTSVPSDFITAPNPNDPTFTVDEGATTRLNEFWVEFSLTPQQVDHETGDLMELGHSTAVTLATRAANALARFEDNVIFQGANAFANGAPANAPGVFNRGVPLDSGLLDLPIGGAADPPQLPPVQDVPVAPLDPANPGVYGSNTFQAVARAYALLQGVGQYGPYALVLPTIPYADTYAPVAAGLVITADRIKPLMTSGFYGTGTLPTANLPNNAVSAGVLISLAGNVTDLVIGLDATTAFMQVADNGHYVFRVVQRFAVRLKDTSGVIRLDFQ